MQFQFEGATYRIAFAHDIPRDWQYHYDRGCGVTLTRIGAPGSPSGSPRMASGPVVLWCDKHGVKLSALSKRERVRGVSCQILRNDPDGWRMVLEGRGQVNVKAGDRYDRETGRRAALANAINPPMRGTDGHFVLCGNYWRDRPEFRERAWTAYLNRPRTVAAKRKSAQ